jgi:peptidoglycan-N-acetylmuramic acid deacetylase
MLKNKISITIVILRICVILFVLLFLLATDFSSFHTGNGDLSEEESGNAATENVGTSDLETEEPTESIPPTGTTKIPSTSVSPDGIKEESATALPPSSQEAQESGASSSSSQQPHPSTSTETSVESTSTPVVQETQDSTEETTVQETTPNTTTQETTTEATQTGPAQFVVHGNSENKEVAFTFDDSGEGLSYILDILDQNGIKGSFFLLAGELRKNPELWQQAAENGHLILNHTVNHYTDLAQRSEDTIRSEILGWEDAAREVLGEEYLIKMKNEFAYFRSPGGLKSDRLLTILGELGYSTMFYWTVEDVFFSKHNPDGISIADHYVQDASNGGIFLMHPGNWGSVDEIIDRLTEEGYALVPVSGILD